jgi:DNA-binding NtrC family response regulator
MNLATNVPVIKDISTELIAMLNMQEHPAILVTANYEIIAANAKYCEKFGALPKQTTSLCYQVSHGYQRPCDESGEQCPLKEALESKTKARVLHIHQTPRGREHVDVELVPLHDMSGRLNYFVEILKPIKEASAEVNRSVLVGASKPFNQMIERISRVAPTEASVLLLGESGTGKELVARAIHQSSQRANKAMVTLECAGLTETLFESEVFGHIRGAFTGANNTKVGLAEEVNGGTLFLDEIADVPLELQVKLLRLLETGTFRPVGSTETRRTDFRLIAATHKNLPAMMRAGQFRQDLYFRINVFPLQLPPLRARKDDLGLITRSLLGRLSPTKDYALTERAMKLMEQQSFPGNVRELRNILARAIVLANTNLIDHRVIGQALSLETTLFEESPNEAFPSKAAIDSDILPHSSYAGLDSQVNMAYHGAPFAGRIQAKVSVSETSELPKEIGSKKFFPSAIGLKAERKLAEIMTLRELLAQNNGDKQATAEQAGISLRTLYRKLRDC